MGEMFKIPAGEMVEIKLHKFAVSMMRSVPKDAFGMRFPDAACFAALSPATQRLGALLAREAKAFAGFAAASGEPVTKFLQRPVPPVDSLARDDDEVRSAGCIAARQKVVIGSQKEVVALVEHFTMRGDTRAKAKRVTSLRLYQLAQMHHYPCALALNYFTGAVQASFPMKIQGDNKSPYIMARVLKPEFMGEV